MESIHNAVTAIYTEERPNVVGLLRLDKGKFLSVGFKENSKAVSPVIVGM